MLFRSFGHTTPSMGMLAPESGANSEWLVANAAAMLNQQVQVDGDELDTIENLDILDVQIIDDYTPPASDSFMQPDSAPETDLVQTARKFEAQTLLANANIAYEERRLNDAMASYNNLLNNFGSSISDQERSLASQRLNEIEVSLGIQGGP